MPSAASNIPSTIIDLIAHSLLHAEEQEQRHSPDYCLSRYISARLAQVNRHWRKAIKRTSIHTTAAFGVGGGVQAYDNIRRWISKRKNVTISYLEIVLLSVDHHKPSLLAAALQGCHVDTFKLTLPDKYTFSDMVYDTQYFEKHREYHLELALGLGAPLRLVFPKDFTAAHLIIENGTDDVKITLSAHNVHAPFIKHLRSIEAFNLAFEGFKEGADGTVFESLEVLALQWNSYNTRDAHQLARILNRSPTLQVLSLSNHSSFSRSRVGEDAVQLPATLPHLHKLVVERVKVDLSVCALPSLKQLYYFRTNSISDWDGVGDELEELVLCYCTLNDAHTLLQPQDFAKFGALRLFNVNGIFSPTFYQLFNNGSFSHAMPLLQKLIIRACKPITTDALNAFLSNHTHITNVNAKACPLIALDGVLSEMRHVVVK